MAKKANPAANKVRLSKSKGSHVNNRVEIIDEYPKEVPYTNPAGMKYVRAIVTDANGDTEEKIICVGFDELERIKKGK